MPLLRRLIAAALALAGAPGAAQQADQTLTGVITGADHQRYRALPFDVPPGVERITLRLTYDKANKTVIDLGLWDPERFRGWSGGTRDRVTVAFNDASAGYLPGTLPPGRWHVQFGVPNARAQGRSAYRVEIFLDRGAARHATAAIADPPINPAPGWYRGDLHMHDAHSDGSCTSQSGKRVPCPLFRTVAAAAEAGLDFVAVTDHNTVSHWSGLRELQPMFDRLLLIPGTEITTFRGHANIFGPARWVDFRVGTPAVPDIAALQRDAEDAGAILSINHPALPSGEVCMGCGWTAEGTDWSRVTAVEAINGLIAEGPLSGLGFWYARLNEGKRLTGIAGSDNHDPGAGADKARIGRPTTVVFAQALSQAAILDGIRKGKVFIDVEGTRDRMLDVTVKSGALLAAMGESIASSRGGMSVRVRTTPIPGASAVLIVNGKQDRSEPLSRSGASAPAEIAFRLRSPCGWLSVNVVDRENHPLLIGNPIYVTCR